MPSNIPRRSNIVSDRGPAKYFHGRAQILHDFKDLMGRAKDTVEGRTTMLIQGAPGAGKTALLDVLSKRAKESGWSIAEIDPPALWDPEELSYYLGKGTRAQITSVSGQVGVDAVVKAEGKLDVAVQRHRPTTLKILAAGKRPLLLILDEAQTLGTTNTPPSQELAGVATNVLNSIHNGRLKRPVILLAAGLGMSKASFVGLGISRFKGGCFVELGGLGKDSERAVIRDWLIKEGGAKGDPTPWIDQIAQKTHGWPQHISAYGDAAAKQIQHDRGEMTAAGLDIVHRLGAERREAYYEQRTEEIDWEERRSLARLIQTVSIDHGLGRREIVGFLSREYGEVEAKDLFRRAVEKGILHSQKGVYTIPIPSMQSWLISNYTRERIETPPIPSSTLPPSRNRDSGVER